MRFRSIAAVFASIVLALAAASCGDDDGDAAGEGTTSTAGADGDAGESGDGPGAELPEDVAAEVGGTEIAAQEIAEEASALAESPQMSEQLGEQSGDQARELLQAEVLTYAIQAELLIGAAESLDRSVTDEDVADARTQLEDEAGGADALVESMESQGLSEGFLDQQIRAVAAMNNVQAAVAAESGDDSSDSTTSTTGPNGQSQLSPEEQAAQQYLTEYAAGVEIIVNDDFGTWDAQAARVMPPGGLPGGGAPAPAPGAGSGGSGGAGSGGTGSGDAGTDGGG